MGSSIKSGFGNEHATEAETGALPAGKNSPQWVACDLYTERLIGSAFTVARADAMRTWMYRIRPSVRHVSGLTDIDPGNIRTSPCRESAISAIAQQSPRRLVGKPLFRRLSDANPQVRDLLCRQDPLFRPAS
ncbi:homogentisate 1,2-dioxygenase [Candidatus Poriferisodalis sp.]|uniref:homogentisate 1,2-dioxygenase n=1 Tax=Candidatus Poriferisodalis sp. TaxID=3101277 RepID=UPI003B01B6A2